MSPTEDSAYALPPELVKAAREAEAELRKSIGRAPREYVTHGSGPSLVFSNEGNKIIVSRNDIVDFLGPLVRIDMSATKEREGEPKPKREVSFASVAGNKVLEFIEVQFYELRALICKKNKTSFPSEDGDCTFWDNGLVDETFWIGKCICWNDGCLNPGRDSHRNKGRILQDDRRASEGCFC